MLIGCGRGCQQSGGVCRSVFVVQEQCLQPVPPFGTRFLASIATVPASAAAHLAGDEGPSPSPPPPFSAFGERFRGPLPAGKPPRPLRGLHLPEVRVTYSNTLPCTAVNTGGHHGRFHDCRAQEALPYAKDHSIIQSFHPCVTPAVRVRDPCTHRSPGGERAQTRCWVGR